MSDGEKNGRGTFNESHSIIGGKLATHLARCSKDYPSSPLRVGPFNGTHYFHYRELEGHTKICPQGFYAEIFVDNAGPTARSVQHLVLKEIERDMTAEDWDAEDQSSYLETRDAVVQEKSVFLMGELWIDMKYGLI